MRRKILAYNPQLKEFAKKLRNNSTKSEIQLWKRLSGKQMHGYDFHRQKPIDNYILDFFCYELMLAIELDGLTHQFEDIVEKDMKKETAIKKLGITILRFNDHEVMNDIENVLRAIEGYILNYQEKHAR